MFFEAPVNDAPTLFDPHIVDYKNSAAPIRRSIGDEILKLGSANVMFRGIFKLEDEKDIIGKHSVIFGKTTQGRVNLNSFNRDLMKTFKLSNPLDTVLLIPWIFRLQVVGLSPNFFTKAAVIKFDCDPESKRTRQVCNLPQ